MPAPNHQRSTSADRRSGVLRRALAVAFSEGGTAMGGRRGQAPGVEGLGAPAARPPERSGAQGSPRAAAYAPKALRRALAVAFSEGGTAMGVRRREAPRSRGFRRASGAPAGAERGAGVPASDGDGGSGGAKPPGLRGFRRASGAPAGAERGAGVPASDGDGGSGGAKPPGLVTDACGGTRASRAAGDRSTPTRSPLRVRALRPSGPPSRA